MVMSVQNKNRPGGVLPVPAAATKKPSTVTKPAHRAPAPKLRLIIRRLPPGLIEAEFWDAVGSDWQVGQGKVDWFAFKNGKISRDPSKPSRPARAYLKLKEQSLIDTLSMKLKSTQFKDAKNTTTDSALIGPPSLEFAPYNKTPGGRVRNDGRQGTIDQDPEFIDFLQSLTEPITKPIINNNDVTDGKPDKVTVTPLVQFIKEKKANKAKEKEAAAATKTAKKSQESKDTKGKAKGDSKPTIIVKSSATSTSDKSRPTKVPPDQVKATEKATTSTQPKTPATKPEQKTKEQSSSAAVAPKRERERGNASAAVKMISRDLGLTPKEAKTSRAAKNSGTTTATSTEAKADLKASVPVAVDANTTKSSPAVTTTNSATPTGPKNKAGNQAQQNKQTQLTPQRQQKATPQSNSGSKSAFLKHANPSQGITEELLRTTFAEFGEITRCEIDKKKGLAYIDFTEAESLKKAMSASPVKVASGQVVVLENRSPYRKATGQRGGNDSGNASQQQQQQQQPQNTTSAVSSPQKATTALASPTVVASAAKSTAEPNTADGAAGATGTTTPSAPPTAPRGGRGGGKGSRGGKTNQNADAAKAGGAGNRGGGRDGGKGNRGRGGRGGSDAQTTTDGPQANPTEPVTNTAAPTSTQ